LIILFSISAAKVRLFSEPTTSRADFLRYNKDGQKPCAKKCKKHSEQRKK
jgi:hypothetical protein